MPVSLTEQQVVNWHRFGPRGLCFLGMRSSARMENSQRRLNHHRFRESGRMEERYHSPTTGVIRSKYII